MCGTGPFVGGGRSVEMGRQKRDSSPPVGSWWSLVWVWGKAPEQKLKKYK